MKRGYMASPLPTALSSSLRTCGDPLECRETSSTMPEAESIASMMDSAQSAEGRMSLGAIQHFSALLSRNSRTWEARSPSSDAWDMKSGFVFIVTSDHRTHFSQHRAEWVPVPVFERRIGIRSSGGKGAVRTGASPCRHREGVLRRALPKHLPACGAPARGILRVSREPHPPARPRRSGSRSPS